MRSERVGGADPPKAMITILVPPDHDRWLTGGYDDVVALLRPYHEAEMTVRGTEFPTRRAPERSLLI